jgi:hypothetical protein
MPQGGEILRQSANGIALGSRKQARLLMAKAFIVFLQLLLGSELGFPVFSSLARDQTMLGFAKPVMARSAIGFEGGTLEPLLP